MGASSKLLLSLVCATAVANDTDGIVCAARRCCTKDSDQVGDFGCLSGQYSALKFFEGGHVSEGDRYGGSDDADNKMVWMHPYKIAFEGEDNSNLRRMKHKDSIDCGGAGVTVYNYLTICTKNSNLKKGFFVEKQEGKCHKDVTNNLNIMLGSDIFSGPKDFEKPYSAKCEYDKKTKMECIYITAETDDGYAGEIAFSGGQNMGKKSNVNGELDFQVESKPDAFSCKHWANTLPNNTDKSEVNDRCNKRTNKPEKNNMKPCNVEA